MTVNSVTIEKAESKQDQDIQSDDLILPFYELTLSDTHNTHKNEKTTKSNTAPALVHHVKIRG